MIMFMETIMDVKLNPLLPYNSHTSYQIANALMSITTNINIFAIIPLQLLLDGIGDGKIQLLSINGKLLSSESDLPKPTMIPIFRRTPISMFLRISSSSIPDLCIIVISSPMRMMRWWDPSCSNVRLLTKIWLTVKDLLWRTKTLNIQIVMLFFGSTKWTALTRQMDAQLNDLE